MRSFVRESSRLAMVAYIGCFTAEHCVDAVGWPLALIAFGLVMIALRAAAVAIGRYIRLPLKSATCS
jgi:hypothetical protein